MWVPILPETHVWRNYNPSYHKLCGGPVSQTCLSKYSASPGVVFYRSPERSEGFQSGLGVKSVFILCPSRFGRCANHIFFLFRL